MRQCPPPSAIAAALTVFEGQAVFRTIVRGTPNRIVLVRFRHGSRTVLAEQILP